MKAGQKVYNARKWRRVRKAYLESKNYICERCGKPAQIVHHKKYLTAENANDSNIAYNFDNLEALCQDCHNIEHEHFTKSGAVFTDGGDVVGVHTDKATQEFISARKKIASMDFNPPCC